LAEPPAVEVKGKPLLATLKFRGPWRQGASMTGIDRIEVENNMIQIEQHKVDSGQTGMEKFDKWVTIGMVLLFLINVASIGWAVIEKSRAGG